MPDRYSAFQVGELQPLQSDLGYLALTVVVDNLTPSWVYVAAAGRYVPPFTYGATFPLGAGVQVAQAAWATPPGITPPTAGTGQAQLTFTSALLPPSNGQAVVTPSQQVLCKASAPSVTGAGNSFTLAGGLVLGFQMGTNGATQATYAVPAGTNSLLIAGTFSYTPNSNGSNVTGTVKVVGGTTGTVYVQTLGGTSAQEPQPPIQCTVSPAADPTVIVSFTLSGSDNGGGNRFTGNNIEVVASFGGAALAVEGSGSGNPVAVNLIQSAGGGVAVDTVIPRVPISEPGTQPGFAQGAGGANAVINLTAPVGGRTYRFHTITWSFSASPPAGAVCIVQNGSSTTVWAALVNTPVAQQVIFPHGGMLVAGAASVTVTNAGTTTVDLAITYTSE